MAELMKLAQILTEQASRVADVTVDVTRNMPWVSIYNEHGDEIFLQGDDAARFVAECDRLYHEVQTLGMDVIELAVAAPYCENLWN